MVVIGWGAQHRLFTIPGVSFHLGSECNEFAVQPRTSRGQFAPGAKPRSLAAANLRMA